MTYKIVSKTGIVKDEAKQLPIIDAQLVEASLLVEDEIIKYAYDADAVIVGPTEPYTRQVIEALKKCKIISRQGIGYNNIDIAAATEQGIPVSYVPDATVEEVSDHTIALLLCFSRKILPVVQAVKEGVWWPGGQGILALIKPIYRLSDQTLGLIGLGRIGSMVCNKAKSFGMKIIVHDPYVNAEEIRKMDAEPVDFDSILTESDYISLHLPLTEITKHCFGMEQFKKMKPTGYLINTSRGGLIDEEALFTSLSKGYIAGAGLDVTDPEPLKPDSPLLKMPNVIITAHTAFYSERSISELGLRAIEAVLLALSGQWPRNLANPEVKEKANCRITG